MLNEHERENGPEEGEYHFSDEGGYESNIDEEEAKAPTVTEGSSLAAKFSSYRRFVILGAIFAGVLLVAYLIVPPLTTSTSTDITATANPPQPPAAMATPVAEVSKAPTTVAPKPVAIESSRPAATKTLTNLIATEKEKLATETNKVMAEVSSRQSAAPSIVTMPVTQPTLTETAPGGGSQVSTATESALPASPFAPIPTTAASAAAQEFIAAPMGTLLSSASPVASPAAIENKALLDRLTAIEETNTKLIGQLHVEYTQKLAAYEAEDKALQDQVRTLNNRLATMEVEMNKLVLALNKQQPSSNNDFSENSNNTNNVNLSAPHNSSASATAIPPIQSGYNKPSYTVQAIIPGRAWLRSDNGETITVAEGDMLKSLGRVTKIDPYDGTIQVDTGEKVITLTYGNGDYA